MMMMSRAALATLVSEIEQSRPTPEWDSTDLKKFKTQIELKTGEKKTLRFDELVILHKTLKNEIDFRETRIREIKDALETAMLVADEKAVVCEGYPVSYITKKGSRKIVAEKLLSNGVSADVIARATEIGPDSNYVLIGKAKKD
jgi:hypothetical protein